jgi:hypothetical protein
MEIRAARRAIRRIALCMLCAASQAVFAQDWGSVTTSSTGGTLENSVIRVVYGKRTFSDGNWTYSITQFIIKEAPTENNAGGDQMDGIWQSANVGTGELQSATVAYDGEDRKTIRFQYSSSSTDVTIYPNCPILQIDYLQSILETVDIATPGGGGTASWVFYGGDQWRRGYDQYPASYYNAPEYGDPDDAGSLNYQGWFIAGAINNSHGRGYIRIMPVADVSIIKLLPWGGAGFEWFPHFSGNKGGNRAFTGYIMAATNGADDVLTLGPRVVDWINGGENPFDGPTSAHARRPGNAGLAPATEPHLTLSVGASEAARVFTLGGRLVPYYAPAVLDPRIPSAVYVVGESGMQAGPRR